MPKLSVAASCWHVHARQRLFHDFCLEDHVPDDHLLRRIDGFLDLSDVR